MMDCSNEAVQVSLACKFSIDSSQAFSLAEHRINHTNTPALSVGMADIVKPGAIKQRKQADVHDYKIDAPAFVGRKLARRRREVAQAAPASPRSAE